MSEYQQVLNEVQKDMHLTNQQCHKLANLAMKYLQSGGGRSDDEMDVVNQFKKLDLKRKDRDNDDNDNDDQYVTKDIKFNIKLVVQGIAVEPERLIQWYKDQCIYEGGDILGGYKGYKLINVVLSVVRKNCYNVIAKVNNPASGQDLQYI